LYFWRKKYQYTYANLKFVIFASKILIMKKTVILFFIFIFSNNLTYSQELILHKDFPGVTWPFLWDIEEDINGNLYVCSEQGILYIKTNGVWEEFDLDPSSQADARGIAIDDQGVAWIATEDGLYSFSNGQVLDHFTSSNSDLPSDVLREIRYHNNELWIVLNQNGLVKKSGDTFTHFTESNSQLGTDYIDDIEITNDGTLIIGADEIVQFVSANTWTSYDFDDIFGFQTWVYDIFVDHNNDIWFSTWKGVVKFDSSSSQFENLKSTYGSRKYSAIIYTPNDELWLCELFEGLHYFDGQNDGVFFDGDLSGQPSQVFDFHYYQDTVRVVGNIGATVTGLTVDFSSSTDEKLNKSISIYPNPVSDYLHISANNDKLQYITIRDYLGKIVHTSEGQIDDNIDVSNLNSGQYTVELITNKGYKTASKFIKL
jgi:hypothetical protein